MGIHSRGTFSLDFFTPGPKPESNESMCVCVYVCMSVCVFQKQNNKIKHEAKRVL